MKYFRLRNERNRESAPDRLKTLIFLFNFQKFKKNEFITFDKMESAILAYKSESQINEE